MEKNRKRHDWLVRKLNHWMCVACTCDKDKTVHRSPCRCVWRDIKWPPLVRNQPVNSEYTRTYSLQSSNHKVRWKSVLFSHVVVLNEEEAGDNILQRVYMQFKVTLRVYTWVRLWLKMITVFSKASVATYRIPVGI